MPTAGNYLEPANGYEAIGYNAGYDAAKKWVEGEGIKFGLYDSANVFLTDGVDGYLFGIYAASSKPASCSSGVTDFDYFVHLLRSLSRYGASN